MSNQIALLQKDITDQVSGKLSELENSGLQLPPNYNAQNALKSAFFKLKETKDRNKQPALDVCTKESIANTLLDMVTQGLTPAKTQCYFIVYGKELQLNRSYFGTQAVLKRLSNVKDVWANVIYQEDDFVIGIEKGREVLVEHKTSFENKDGDIKGAYAIVEKEDGELVLTTMTKKEIDTSWSQTKTGGAVQKKFPQEMAKRTVINRAAKSFINTSDDSDLLIEAINNSTENEYEERERRMVDPVEEVQEEVKSNANKQVVDFEEPIGKAEPAERKDVKPIDEEQAHLFDNLTDLDPGF